MHTYVYAPFTVFISGVSETDTHVASTKYTDWICITQMGFHGQLVAHPTPSPVQAAVNEQLFAYLCILGDLAQTHIAQCNIETSESHTNSRGTQYTRTFHSETAIVWLIGVYNVAQ